MEAPELTELARRLRLELPQLVRNGHWQAAMNAKKGLREIRRMRQRQRRQRERRMRR